MGGFLKFTGTALVRGMGMGLALLAAIELAHHAHGGG